MTPHLDKLNALLLNSKLPPEDRPKVLEALQRYAQWRTTIDGAAGDADTILSTMVAATNEYKKFIELDLIFDSHSDFLYRQKGQLKLDNTVLEEFLPKLVDVRLVPGLAQVESLTFGPQQCFAGLFIGPLAATLGEGGVFIKTKNQDFTVGRRLFMRTSTSNEFPAATTLTSVLNIGYFVAEIKTNLDKTMFQEAAATARELKASVHEAVYVLLCEWLDMPPIDTRVTEIDRVILLRKGKRLSSSVRENFSSYAGRQAARAAYVTHLTNHPLSVDSFRMVIKMMQDAFPEERVLNEGTVLNRGYF
ncbi:Bpu10I family restriction endonuclease [Caenimonas sp. SL110]|uniref:Bpu10I family restriction endonuclease n=1 Tax=Caenimonas sp. SL110 TaxID=1450524 RepID=UPI000652E794|nr:Bpu10I family restriction endonuclease [Caenimonas sp. SL110]